MTSTLPPRARTQPRTCSLEPFPRPGRTAAHPRRLCDPCPVETPATREIRYLVLEDGGRRERTLDVCSRPSCEHDGRLHVERAGAEYLGTDDIHLLAEPGAQGWPDLRSSWQTGAEGFNGPWHIVDFVRRLDELGQFVPAWPGARLVPSYGYRGPRCGVRLARPGGGFLAGEPGPDTECPGCLARSELFRTPVAPLAGPPPAYGFAPPAPLPALLAELLGDRR